MKDHERGMMTASQDRGPQMPLLAQPVPAL